MWRREENQPVNNKEQWSRSFPNVLNGLGAREEGLSIDVYQTAEHFDLLLLSGQAYLFNNDMCTCLLLPVQMLKFKTLKATPCKTRFLFLQWNFTIAIRR